MIYVVSMHRSGSSLLTGLMRECGIDAGPSNEFIDAKEDNPKGFFERRDVVDLNRQIIRYGDFNANVPDIDFDPALAGADYRDQLAQLSGELQEKGVDIIKDPRLCLTLPLWTENDAQPLVIYLVRSSRAVARSLQTRQSIPLQIGEALWEYYNRQVFLHIGQIPLYRLSLEDFVKRPAEVLGELVAWLKIQGVDIEMITEEHLRSFFDQTLIHHGRDHLQGTDCKVYARFLSAEREELAEYVLSEKSTALLQIWEEIERLGYCPERIVQSLRKTRAWAEKQREELRETRAWAEKQREELREMRAWAEKQREELRTLQSQQVAAGRYLNRYLNSKPGKVAEKVTANLSLMKGRDPQKNPISELKKLLLIESE